jgi:PIN domain nuclease of toxin-antitoxin system
VDLLLDTQAFIWWDSSSPRLSAPAKAAISDPANIVYVSAASVWEISIKVASGKLKFTGSPTAAIVANGFQEIAIAGIHAEFSGTMTWPHKDPFDRVIVATALIHKLHLVTSDSIMIAASLPNLIPT